ncbi:hypothetical protein Lser_V15G31453 [Lactuca serriola]
MSHLLAVKQIFRYVKGTKSLGIWYPENESFLLQKYSDSNYVGLQMDRKSTSGGCQFLGGRLISWSSKKQKSIALSTAKAEYNVAVTFISQVLWMKSQLYDYENIELIFVPSDDEIADVITKTLDETKFSGFLNKMGMMMLDPQFFQEAFTL